MHNHTLLSLMLVAASIGCTSTPPAMTGAGDDSVSGDTISDTGEADVLDQDTVAAADDSAACCTPSDAVAPLDADSPDGSDAVMLDELVSVVSASVTASASAGYQLAVGVMSTETGCEQYANWWEAVDIDGTTLLYRRILGHSHVNEQPFVRSGGPVTGSDDVVVVRAHGNVGGYGRQALQVTLSDGSSVPITLPVGFGAALETAEPLPTSCAF